ncbi:MAG: DUF1295 domain-containing protein [Rhodothermia bacterium]|nr:DUF1295 domain-containing protein [Rhodothermia bacterium]
MTGTSATASRDRLWILVGYLIAVAAAGACVYLMDGHPLIEVFAADVVGTIVIFLFSVVFRNSSFYDPYWSVAPPLIAAWFVLIGEGAVEMRQWVVLALVVAWSIRLTGNWLYGWSGMNHEDWRYVQLREQTGALWWPVSFLGVHLMPTIVVFAGCVPLYPALVSGSVPVNWLDAIALLVGVAAVWLEYRSDLELHQFRKVRGSRQEVLTTGVWAWCRHPNYLGEMGFWISLFLFGLASTDGMYPWSWVGAVAMVMLFVGISIPMIERRLSADKPAYAEYKKDVEMLLPLSKNRSG